MPKISCRPALCTPLGAFLLVPASSLGLTPNFLSNETLREDRSLASPQTKPDGKTGLLQIAGSTAKGGAAHPCKLKALLDADESKTPNAIPPVKTPSRAEPKPLAIQVSDLSISPNGKFIAITTRAPETPGEKNKQEWAGSSPAHSFLRCNLPQPFLLNARRSTTSNALFNSVY